MSFKLKPNITEYQNKCCEFAIYPDKGNNLIYTYLGFLGELSETFTKYYGPIYDKNELKKEIGDVYWYISMCFYEIGIRENINLVIEKYYNDVFCIKYMPLEKFDYDDLRFMLNVCSFSENLKKQIRDKKELDINKIKNILCFGFLRMYELCKSFNFDIEEVLEENIEKLTKRKLENKLSGDGDNR